MIQMERTQKMEWTCSETLALAREGCTSCRGFGLRRNAKGETSPCKCVLRKIFSACYSRFRYCTQLSPHLRITKLERLPGALNSSAMYGRPNEEYVADFCLLGKRALANRPVELQIFTFCFLLGVERTLCARRLKIPMGLFNSTYYRTQELVGLSFRGDTEPGIFPIDSYFGGSVSTARAKANVGQTSAFTPVRAPLALPSASEGPALVLA